MRMIFRKFLSQRTVMPYSDTPPKPARIRSSSESHNLRASTIGCVRNSSGTGSIFRPSMATTPKPSFER